jgi:hypothetical protein
MVGENVGNLFLYMCSTFQNNSCNGILKSIMGCNVFIPAWALKQMNTQIINGTRYVHTKNVKDV